MGHYYNGIASQTLIAHWNGTAWKRLPSPNPRQALNSSDPARAVIAALTSFHALRSGQLRALLLTGIRDGRLHLPGRTILLAPPVRGWQPG